MTDDHDALLRLEVVVEQFVKATEADSIRVHIELGRLQQAVWQLQQDAAQAKAGLRLMIALSGFVGAIVGGVIGAVGEFFSRH